MIALARHVATSFQDLQQAVRTDTVDPDCLQTFVQWTHVVQQIRQRYYIGQRLREQYGETKIQHRP